VCSQPSWHNAISSTEPAELSDAGNWNGGSTKWSVLGIREFLAGLLSNPSSQALPLSSRTGLATSKPLLFQLGQAEIEDSTKICREENAPLIVPIIFLCPTGVLVVSECSLHLRLNRSFTRIVSDGARAVPFAE